MMNVWSLLLVLYTVLGRAQHVNAQQGEFAVKPALQLR